MGYVSHACSKQICNYSRSVDYVPLEASIARIESRKLVRRSCGEGEIRHIKECCTGTVSMRLGMLDMGCVINGIWSFDAIKIPIRFCRRKYIISRVPDDCESAPLE